MITEGLTFVYLVIAIFLLGFGIAEEMSFVNPDYKFVIAVAVFWPLFLLYGIGQKVFS